MNVTGLFVISSHAQETIRIVIAGSDDDDYTDGHGHVNSNGTRGYWTAEGYEIALMFGCDDEEPEEEPEEVEPEPTEPPPLPPRQPRISTFQFYLHLTITRTHNVD